MCNNGFESHFTSRLTSPPTTFESHQTRIGVCTDRILCISCATCHLVPGGFNTLLKHIHETSDLLHYHVHMLILEMPVQEFENVLFAKPADYNDAEIKFYDAVANCKLN